MACKQLQRTRHITSFSSLWNVMSRRYILGAIDVRSIHSKGQGNGTQYKEEDEGQNTKNIISTHNSEEDKLQNVGDTQYLLMLPYYFPDKVRNADSEVKTHTTQFDDAVQQRMWDIMNTKDYGDS